MTDECDSSFVFKQRPIKVEPDENDDVPAKMAPVRKINPFVSEPPLIVQKVPTISHCMPKVVSVRPVARVQSPNKNRIDRIALNLKIQQEKKLQTCPRTLKDCHKILFETLKAQSDDSVDHDCLSNLTWLNKFDLTSTGLTPLSPPLSPRQDDEADGCCLKPVIKIKHNSPTRPSYTFSCLIFLAIESSHNKRLSVKEINQWVIENFVYYKNVPSGSWKNSIRHNLASNQCFSKVDKNLLTMRDFSGKGSLWCINPIYRPMLLDNLAKIGLEYDRLNAIACLQDIVESPKSDFNSRASRITQCKPAIINPNIKISVSQQPKITSVKTKNALQRSSSSVVKNVDASECTDMDAVNALLSMKSRASSMPAVDSRKGRRKQLFRRPTRRVDIEDEDGDEDLIEDMKSSDNELEEESSDENMLQIDESACNSDDESDRTKRKLNDNELDNVKKVKVSVNEESHDLNPLLELSRAASIVEYQN